MVEEAVSMSEGWTVNSQSSFDGFQKRAQEVYKDSGYVVFKWTTGRQRTAAQNDAIHLFCQHIADACNDSGYEMVISSFVLKADLSIPWTQSSVKERIWRTVQLAKYPKRRSTTQLLRNEVSEIADVITLYLGEKKGLVVPFPSKEKGLVK